MTRPSSKMFTELLDAVGDGSTAAQSRLWSAIYNELHAMARKQMAGEVEGQTLQSTALVHEAYVRLTGGKEVQWANRKHFFKAASNVMRQIRIDAARKRKRKKRGGDRGHVPFVEGEVAGDEVLASDLAIDDALKELERKDPRKAEIVTLRYFGGLTIDETALALELSPRTVDSEWRFAKAWLHRELDDGDDSIA